jgi:hypothetical protein
MLRGCGRRAAISGIVLVLLALAFPRAAAASDERTGAHCKRGASLPGQRATLLAHGFLPHETVTGTLRPGNVAVGRTTAAARGRAQLSFTVPAGLSGSYQATLTGGASAVTVSCLLLVAADPVRRAPVVAPMSGGQMALVGVAVIALLLATGGTTLVLVSRRTAAGSRDKTA